MSSTIRVGIVGSGFGVSVHLPALRAHSRFEVVALASPNTAQEHAKQAEIAHAYASCKEMLAHEKLDAVIIASPPFAHHEDTLAALNAGVHVLCEKPMGLSAEECEAMVAAEKTAGTACGICFEFRYLPQRIALREMVANGHLDPIREVELSHLMGFLRRDTTRRRGWWFQRERGGGIAGAILSHAIDAANHLLARVPQHTTGLLRTANVQRTDAQGEFTSNVDDGAFALLDYGDGIVARLSVDGCAAVESFTLAVHGEARTAVTSGTSALDLRLFSVDDEETNELDCAASPYTRFAPINAAVPPMMQLYDDWVLAIDGQPHSLPSFHDGLAVARVLQALGYSSTKANSAVSSG